MAAQKWHSSGTGKNWKLLAGLRLPLRPVSARFSGRWRALKTRRNRTQKKDATRPPPLPAPAARGDLARGLGNKAKSSTKKGGETAAKCHQKKAETAEKSDKERPETSRKSEQKRPRKFRKVCTKKMHPSRSHKTPRNGCMERKTGRKVQKSASKKRPRRGAGAVVTCWRLLAGACVCPLQSCSQLRASI